MGFLDDLKVLGADLLAKGSVAAKEAAQKASDAADMAKIKVDIAAREKEIKDLYAKIGKAFYEEYKDDAIEFAEDIAEIKAKFAVIDELNSKYELYREAIKAGKEEQTAPVAEEEVDEAIEIVPAHVEEVVEDAVEAAEEAFEDVCETAEEAIEEKIEA